MKQQKFKVTLSVTTEVGQGLAADGKEKSYLTENRVKKQIERFLQNRSICEGLPCHGNSTIRVTDVIENFAGKERLMSKE